MRISDWSSDVCSSDLAEQAWGRGLLQVPRVREPRLEPPLPAPRSPEQPGPRARPQRLPRPPPPAPPAPVRRSPGCPTPSGPDTPDRATPVDRKSTRLNSITNAHLVCRLLLDKKKPTQN